MVIEDTSTFHTKRMIMKALMERILYSNSQNVNVLATLPSSHRSIAVLVFLTSLYACISIVCNKDYM